MVLRHLYAVSLNLHVHRNKEQIISWLSFTTKRLDSQNKKAYLKDELMRALLKKKKPMKRFMIMSIALLSSNAFAATYSVNCSSADQKMSITTNPGTVTLNGIAIPILNDDPSDWNWGIDVPGKSAEVLFKKGNKIHKLKLDTTQFLKEVPEKVDCREATNSYVSVEYTFSRAQNAIAKSGVILCHTRQIHSNKHCELEH
jgi:hypothetical protein